MSKGFQVAAGATLIALLLGWYAATNLEEGASFAYYQTLEEFVGEMCDEAPAWAKKQLANSDEDDLTSSERLVALAEQENFVVAAFGFAHESGKPF